MKIYGIFDKKSECIVNIITAPTDATACRNAEMLCKDGSPYLLYADDYKLICLCNVDVHNITVESDIRVITEFSIFAEKNN